MHIVAAKSPPVHGLRRRPPPPVRETSSFPRLFRARIRWYAQARVGTNERKPAPGDARLRGRWLWVACSAFAVIAVVSAGGRKLTGPSGTVAVGDSVVLHGERNLGTRGPDTVRGTSDNDLIFSFGGPDTLDAGDGNDLVDPGNGEDVIDAGFGDDHVRSYDDERDVVDCGPGDDIAYVDALDEHTDCEEVIEASDSSWPRTPDPPRATKAVGRYEAAAPLVSGAIVLEDEAWVCRGPVDVDSVKVTIHRRSDPLDAVSLSQNCTGRIGRIEVDTWSGDGIKVQNAGTVPHDLVVESGYVRCYERTGDYHQDGIHVMGGRRITFRNMSIFCGRPGVNANLFIAQGGKEASLPTEVVFEDGRLGPSAAHTILLADAIRSGAQRTVICPGRWFDFMIQASAVAPVDARNVLAAASDPRCAPLATP
jgi:hypothetical protein